MKAEWAYVSVLRGWYVVLGEMRGRSSMSLSKEKSMSCPDRSCVSATCLLSSSCSTC